MTDIDLSQVPAPEIIDQLHYNTILQELIDDIVAYAPEIADTIQLESELARKITEVYAYRILNERKHSNDKALSLMLAYAENEQLDNMGALPFIRTPRKILVEADNTVNPPIEQVMENDNSYRQRLQLALEGFSTAGPEGAYRYHALAASSDVVDVNVKAPKFRRIETPPQLPVDNIVLVLDDDAGLSEPMPGDINVTILGLDNTVEQSVIDQVQNYLTSEDRVPFLDNPRVTPANVQNYNVVANLWFFDGPDESLLLNQANQGLQKYASDRRKLGHDITLSGLTAALHVEGVQRVEIVEPADDIVIDKQSAASIGDITIVSQGKAQ